MTHNSKIDEPDHLKFAANNKKELIESKGFSLIVTSKSTVANLSDK